MFLFAIAVVDVCINSGFADDDERVRAAVLLAALEIVDVHGVYQT